MVEWSITAVLKTAGPKGPVSSNLTVSAILFYKYFIMIKPYTILPEVSILPESKQIVAALEDLVNSGDLLQRLNGNCVASADILQHMLKFHGVDAKILECQVFLVQSTPNSEVKDFMFIGVNQQRKMNPNEIDTHVVVVTETNPPVLIDASISQYMPNTDSILVRVVDPDCMTSEVLAQYNIGNLSITYRPKKSIKLTDLHQKNLLDRFKDSQIINTKISLLQKIIMGIATLSLVNFILNLLMIILSFVHKQ